MCCNKKNNNNKINIPPSRVKFTWFSTDLVTTEAEKGQSKNNFQIRKNIFNRNIFLQILVGKSVKSKTLLQILIKILDPQINFSRIRK